MVLIIAEKPSLARDIADALPYQTSKNADFYTAGNYTITWVFGHMLTLKDPEDYDEQYKDRRNIAILPIYFENWDNKIRPTEDGSVENRVKLIGDLLRNSDSVINAGDPDEEGQLLIDELLRWHNYGGPVKRLDTRNTAQAALQKAFSKMTDNKKWENMGWSAYARSIADFTVGINLTRYFSALNNTHLPVGRVKMPTLGLLVTRDEQIANHQKVYYYEIPCKVKTGRGEVIDAKYAPAKDDPNLTDGRILEKPYAKEKLDLVEAAKGTGNIRKEPVVSKPPLPFNMTKLQVYCSSHFNYTPEETVNITQALREKYKAITYNRSDCQYLSEEHFKEAPDTVAATLQSLGLQQIPGLDTSIKSRCFNDDKITAHFAIIPSGQKVNLQSMTEKEQNVYKAIARFYLIQFMPNAKKTRTVFTLPLSDGGTITASSTEIKERGFLAIIKEDEPDPISILSSIPEGDYPSVVKEAEIKECETKPKPKYTEATLVEDMTRIARYVEDPYIKELLLEKDKDKEGANGSIGTEATRYQIVKDLLDQGYAQHEGKYIVSTPKGREFYRILPTEFKTADLTARWWVMQEDIKAGVMEPADLGRAVLENVKKVLQTEYPLLDAAVCQNGAKESLGDCPLCGRPVVEGKKGYGCSGWKQGCKFVIWKEQETGVFKHTNFTPAIIKKLLAGKSVYVQHLWSEDKQKEFPGKLSLIPEEERGCKIGIELEQESLGTCPACGGAIVEGKRGYGCSNWRDGCKFTIWKQGTEGSLLSKAKITKTMAKKLLKGETVEKVNLYSKAKDKVFVGAIKLEYNEEQGKHQIVPVFKQYGNVIGICPRCGGEVVEGKFSYNCTNQNTGCQFKIQKQAAKGPFSKAEITPMMAQALLVGEHITMSGLWSDKKKKKFKGTVYMDDSQLSEYGASLKLEL